MMCCFLIAYRKMFFSNCCSPQVKFDDDDDDDADLMESQSFHTFGQRRIQLLVGSKLYRNYAIWIAIIYSVMFCSMMIIYELYAPELLQKSLEWKVYVPVSYTHLTLPTKRIV